MTDKIALADIRHCGFIALAGRPNVGKSTLFNRLIGAHLSPVTHKPQTTRYNMRGVLTQGQQQMVFVDTPGLHSGASRSLNRILNKNALRALHSVDVIVMMVVFNQWLPQDEMLLKAVKDSNKPTFLVLNKIDFARGRLQLLKVIETVSKHHAFDEIFPLSALRDKGFDRFIQALGAHLPPRDFLFPEDQLSDRSERFIAAELIRERLILELHQELPYTLHVEIERFEERESMAYLLAIIYIEKERQRGIVIGHAGDRLKRVGTHARHSIEGLLGKRVFLKLLVKTKSTWQRDPVVIESYSSDGEMQ